MQLGKVEASPMSPVSLDTFMLDRDADGVTDWLNVPNDWRRSETRGYRLYWSDRLGYGQVLPRPDPEEIPGFYDVPYYTHGDATGQSDRVAPIWRALSWLAWRADHGTEPDDSFWQSTLGMDAARVIEIGCGNGDTLKRLKSMGHEVIGVEPDPAACEIARAQGLEILAGTAEHLPDTLPEQGFDAVIMLHVLEHCLDPTQALVSARHLLKPGGILVVEVPNNACLGLRQFGETWLFLDVPRHLNFFTSRSLSALISSVGFSVTSQDYLGYVMQFANDWRIQQDAICKAFNRPRSGNWFHRYLLLYLRTRQAEDHEKYCNLRIVARAPTA